MSDFVENSGPRKAQGGNSQSGIVGTALMGQDPTSGTTLFPFDFGGALTLHAFCNLLIEDPGGGARFIAKEVCEKLMSGLNADTDNICICICDYLDSCYLHLICICCLHKRR